jgi:hypothetical protein
MALRRGLLWLAFLASFSWGDLTTSVYTTTIVETSKSTSLGAPSSSPSTYVTVQLRTSTKPNLPAGLILCAALETMTSSRDCAPVFSATSTITSWVLTTPAQVLDVTLTRTATLTSVFSVDGPEAPRRKENMDPKQVAPGSVEAPSFVQQPESQLQSSSQVFSQPPTTTEQAEGVLTVMSTRVVQPTQ